MCVCVYIYIRIYRTGIQSESIVHTYTHKSTCIILHKRARIIICSYNVALCSSGRRRRRDLDSAERSLCLCTRKGKLVRLRIPNEKIFTRAAADAANTFSCVLTAGAHIMSGVSAQKKKNVYVLILNACRTVMYNIRACTACTQ